MCILSTLQDDCAKMLFLSEKKKKKVSAAQLLEKEKKGLKSNASKPVTLFEASASFFLMLKMTWNRSFRSITRGSACMVTEIHQSAKLSIKLYLYSTFQTNQMQFKVLYKRLTKCRMLRMDLETKKQPKTQNNKR